MTTTWLKIAERVWVSRQAVYDNIKRTRKILEDYEMKLHMYSDYIVRSQIFDQILERYPEDTFLQEQVEILSSIDNQGVIMDSLVIYQGIPLCKLLVAEDLSLDYRLSRPMISLKAMQIGFSC